MSSQDQHHEGMSDPSGDGEPPVVLIVEDEKNLANLYTVFLEDTYTVRTAYTGEQALELLDDDIDVALLDRRLQKWSGDQLVDVIQDRRIDCQIAMVTAVTPDVDIANLAIDEYVTKSVSREDLLQVVEELLLRAEANVTQQELLALISRKITLENAQSKSDLEATDEYAKLEHRIERATDRLDIDSAQVGADKQRPGCCPQCDLRWDLSVGDAVGLINLGSYVWKCTGCGCVERITSPSNRRVNRR